MVQNFAKRRNGFRHFGEVNYSYRHQVVHCDNGGTELNYECQLTALIIDYLMTGPVLSSKICIGWVFSWLASDKLVEVVLADQKSCLKILVNYIKCKASYSTIWCVLKWWR